MDSTLNFEFSYKIWFTLHTFFIIYFTLVLLFLLILWFIQFRPLHPLHQSIASIHRIHPLIHSIIHCNSLLFYQKFFLLIFSSYFYYCCYGWLCVYKTELLNWAGLLKYFLLIFYVLPLHRFRFRFRIFTMKNDRTYIVILKWTEFAQGNITIIRLSFWNFTKGNTF